MGVLRGFPPKKNCGSCLVYRALNRVERDYILYLIDGIELAISAINFAIVNSFKSGVTFPQTCYAFCVHVHPISLSCLFVS